MLAFVVSGAAIGSALMKALPTILYSLGTFGAWEGGTYLYDKLLSGGADKDNEKFLKEMNAEKLRQSMRVEGKLEKRKEQMEVDQRAQLLRQLFFSSQGLGREAMGSTDEGALSMLRSKDIGLTPEEFNEAVSPQMSPLDRMFMRAGVFDRRPAGPMGMLEEL